CVEGYKIISLFSNIYDKISYKDIYGQYGYGYCLWNVCYGFMLTIRKKQMRMIKSASNLSSAKAAQLPVAVEKHTELKKWCETHEKNNAWRAR
ncbi:MAG: hypothetical protein LUE14_12000, partial [Clostridiales bacterium]|nr:hypothetical protein [Clostridiales bacterium]